MKKYFNLKLDEEIEKYKKDDDLYEAFRYSLKSGGKQLRPLLTLATASSIGKNYKDVIDLAIAIEFIHNYSLVHDDLPGMDNDTYRRGKLTTHAKYGDYVGILVGDALLTEAFSKISASQTLNNKDKIITYLCQCIGMNGMIYGQYLDMLYENKKINENILKLIHLNKTGALIRASIICPLLSYGIKDEKYLKIANLLGYIYQLQDDIFDSFNIDDKSNYVNIIGYEETKKRLEEYILKLKDILPKNTELETLILKIIERKN